MTQLNLLAELRKLNGHVIAPRDADYDAARAVFYGGIDRRPAAIVRVANAADVARVVSLARETGLELAVRSGGHSVAGHSVSDGGIVLDLSAMKKIDIDTDRRTAWAETGLTAAEYTAATAPHGLATGFGDTGSVGIGGLTLGGGVGYLVRKYGLTIDSLLAADVVTADGQLVRADAESHPDLFWAIRGGGGNFGVATRFLFRLHEVSAVVGGPLILPATPEVISGFIAAADAAPEELSTIANVMPAPSMPFLPPEQHGRLVVLALMAYAGPAEEAQRVLAPFRALAAPVADLVRSMSYAEVFMPDDPDDHPAVSGYSMFIDTVDSDVAETIVERLRAAPTSFAVAQLRVLGGAVARVPVEATAFAHRGRRIMVTLIAHHERPEERPETDAWVADFADALRQEDTGVYVNFLGDEGEARVHDAYPGATWARLAAVKARYDPTNLFRLNQNIPPAG